MTDAISIDVRLNGNRMETGLCAPPGEGSREVVHVGKDEQVSARIATPEECREHGFPPRYLLLLVIQRADGSEELFRGDQTIAVADPGRVS
jgi:hypothetical protein